jgi:mannose-1-phosphate guanylyltransferase
MDLSWLDIGSWPAYALTCQTDEAGNALAGGTPVVLESSGTLVASSDPEHLVAVVGCRDLIVVHTPEATLVCARDSAEDVKKLHAIIAERFGEKYV